MLRSAARSYDEATNYTAFIEACACLLASDRSHDAVSKAEVLGKGDRVGRLIKAAVSGAITSNSGLVFVGPELSAFMSALRQVGAADQIFAAAMRLPLHPGRVAVFTSIAGGTVNEGVAKPIRALRLTSADLTPIKAVATVVMSHEFISALSPEAIRLLGTELRGAVALATDVGLHTILTSSASVESSGGNTWAGMVAEIEELLHAVELGIISRPFLLVSQRAMKGLAAAALENGVTTLGVQGGELMGITVIATGGQADGTVTLLDASGLVISDAPIERRTSDEGSVEMNDAPSSNSTTPTHSTLVSLYQIDSRALIAERSFGAKVIRSNAVASLTGVAWGGGGDSPSGF